METEIAHGASERRHAAGNSHVTNRISHDNFTKRLIKITMNIIEKYGLKEGVELKVPSKIWMSLQFTSNNGQIRTADKYTVRLPFARALQTQKLCIDQPHVIKIQRRGRFGGTTWLICII